MTSIPFPISERDSRWKKVKEHLERLQQDAMIVPLGVNFFYLFGKQGNPSERLLAGIIPLDGDPFILSPGFEKSNIERSTGLDDIVTWEEVESPYKILNKAIMDRGMGKNLMVDPHLWFIEVEKIQKQNNYAVTSGHQVLDKLRSIKSDWEITQLQAASKASAQGIMAVIPELKQGLTEIEVFKMVEKEMSSRSQSPAAFGLVQFGENSALPHGAPTTRKLKNDEVVLLDCGTSYNGYQGDITITTAFGKPEGFEEIYDIVVAANRKALDVDKEGMVPANLDKIAREHIEKAGYGKYFTHRLGHGIGLEVHETPYIVGTNSVPLVAGNCHSIEPGIYIPGKFGVRIEDDVHVRKEKTDLLFDFPR